MRRAQQDHQRRGWATDLLIWLTRETNLKTFEEMHYRLSFQPAR